MAKYDDIYVGVDLNGPGGNAFAIVASVIRGLKSARVSNSDIEKFKADALSGDYDHLKEVCSQWVDIEFYGEDYG